MGAAQSSTGASSGVGTATVEVKESYYELLGVQRQATDEEIKKAYRKKALELHPDRNYGSEESATKLFAEVRAAYEVLSDPQERAWYDSHESAILRGGDGRTEDQHFEGDIRVTTADDITRIIGKFNSNLEFSDAPSGFYGFLRETFDHLAREEQVAAEIEGLDIPDYPTFGHKEDEYDDVVRSFYAAWSGFATKKTFSWKDHYRLSEAPDRRYRRLMEKENKRARAEGIQEFNEVVRALVGFVRRRDPRYVSNTQTEAERQKALRDAANAQAARARRANEAKLQEEVPEWTKVREPEELDDSAESEIEEEHFECVACNKTFKSEKQYDAHEKSKKHQKAVHSMKRKMQKENNNLSLDSELSSSGFGTPATVDAAESDGDWTEQVIEEEHSSPIMVSEDEIDPETIQSMDNLHVEDADNARADENDEASEPATSSGDESQDSDYAPRSAVKARSLKHPADDTTTTPKKADPPPDPEAPHESHDSKSKLGKAAQKRAKKAAAAATAAADTDKKHSCAVCNATFPSKTRLFQHIKDFGHAAPVPAGGGGGGKGRKGKGR
ncbi:hypothetical protein LTR66_012757 [Elasticomyces elasticus]|nr:hypothetical protein LTR66_012757 [Elasticomyces elasticus]